MSIIFAFVAAAILGIISLLISYFKNYKKSINSHSKNVRMMEDGEVEQRKYQERGNQSSNDKSE